MRILGILLISFFCISAFYLGMYSCSPPSRPNYISAEPNYLNFYYWSNGEGKFKLRNVLKNSEYKFDKICASGEGGVSPYEVRGGRAKLVSGVELSDPLSMSYVSLYFIGDGSYSVMNFDPADFNIEWPFSGCQAVDALSLEISSENGHLGPVTYRIK